MRGRIVLAVLLVALVAAMPSLSAADEPYSGGEVTQTTLAVVPTVLGTTIDAREQLPKTGSSLTGPAIVGLVTILVGATVVWVFREARSRRET
jgi:LPXTG-motif cell wall-anchored protein